MDSTDNTAASDVPETNFMAELELKQQSTEQAEGIEESEAAPMDVSDSSKKADEVCEPTKELVGTSQSEDQIKVTPKKTIEVKATTPPGSQSITIIMSPSSSSQKTQTVRLINPEQIQSSLSMQTIQLPLKTTSPIVLKATTIPMPTKTVSIIAKPSTSTVPAKVTSTVVLPSTSKTPTKSLSVRKGVVGVGKGESSKSEAALHQMVRPGGVVKAKMQSARVIVVPLQITKEMIAAKQKAAGKTSKLGAAIAGKSESGFKAGVVSIGESSGTDKKLSAKGKTPVKQVKTGMTFKRKDESDSEVRIGGVKPKTSLNVASKAVKKLASVGSGSESESLDLESIPTGKLQKVKPDKKSAAETEKVDDQVKCDEDPKEGKEVESKDSEGEQGGKTKVSKVKKVLRKKDEDSEESDDEEALGKPRTKQLSKDKNEEDVESEVETIAKPKAVGAKGKTPKKSSKKDEEDEEQDLEAEIKSRVSSVKGNKVKKESQVKEELDAEVKEDDGAEDKQAKETEPDSEDSEVKAGSKEKKKKKAKEEEGELLAADSGTDEDQKSDSELVKVKKTPGRKKKDKTKEEEPVVVTSTRRSKRESNLSVKLAEWGLVPMATPKSHSKPAVSKTPTTKSPIATKSPMTTKTPAAPKTPAAAKTPAATKTPAASKAEVPRSPVVSKSSVASKLPVIARSPVAVRSPSAAVSPTTLLETISPPVSPGEQQQQLPQTGVTVTVVKDDTCTEPAEELSQENSASAAPAKPGVEKSATKSGAEWIAKASSILSSGSPKVVQKAVPKSTPKAAPKVGKVEKSTPVQPVKQVIKVPEKVIVSKAVEVKQMQNKSLMCKPIMMTKATSCNPIRINKDTQTDGSDEGRKKKTMFVPVPVPFILPAPVATCALPAPFPVPLPVPLPVPCFIPSTRKSIDSLMKSLQELHDQMPSDPFEADLLAMAEAVTAAHNEVPDCIVEPEDIKPIMRSDPNIGVAATTMLQQSSGGESSEDMLELALRMATEMPEEGSLEIEAVRERMASHPEASQTTEFGTILHNGSTKRGASSASDDERNHGKKARLEVFAGSHNVSGSAVAFATALPISESHMKLKYSYGVKAWKYWVSEKNAELEKTPSASKGRPKLFKQEILQCGTDELNLALSLFVKEVRKPTGEEYAPDSIYYLCLGIQHYLYENGRIDNVFTDFYYKGFTDALNAQLSGFQVCLNTQGMIVCRVTEEHLWESRQLGAHSPYVLLNTLIYFNTKYFQLNSAEMHMTLSFANIMKQFKKNLVSSDTKQGRSVYLRYNPTTTVYTGTDGTRRKMATPPINPSEQLENSDNPLRCPVKLYEFYMSRCPETIRNRNDLFYLTPEVSCVPDSPVWYSTVPLGTEVMSKMLNRILVVREIQEACLHLQPVFG